MSPDRPSRGPILTLVAALVAIASLAILAVTFSTRAPAPSPSPSTELQAAWTAFLACRDEHKERRADAGDRFAALLLDLGLGGKANTVLDALEPSERPALEALDGIIREAAEIGAAEIEVGLAELREINALVPVVTELEKLGISSDESLHRPCPR